MKWIPQVHRIWERETTDQIRLKQIEKRACDDESAENFQRSASMQSKRKQVLINPVTTSNPDVARLLVVRAVPNRYRWNISRRCAKRGAEANLRYMQILAGCLAVLLTLFSASCRRSSGYVVVHVYRNWTSPVGRELDRRFYEFNAKKPRLASGKEIVIATFEASDYEKFLKDRVQDVKPQLIVLDSPTQIASNAVVGRESSHYINVCAAVHACPTPVPAIVPSWVSGEELEATTHVVDGLRLNQ